MQNRLYSSVFEASRCKTIAMDDDDDTESFSYYASSLSLQIVRAMRDKKGYCAYDEDCQYLSLMASHDVDDTESFLYCASSVRSVNEGRASKNSEATTPRQHDTRPRRRREHAGNHRKYAIGAK